MDAFRRLALLVVAVIVIFFTLSWAHAAHAATSAQRKGTIIFGTRVKIVAGYGGVLLGQSGTFNVGTPIYGFVRATRIIPMRVHIVVLHRWGGMTTLTQNTKQIRSYEPSDVDSFSVNASGQMQPGTWTYRWEAGNTIIAQGSFTLR